MDFTSNGMQYPVYSKEQIQTLEASAINEHNIKSYELMQRAGKAAFQFIRTHYPDCRRILIVTGGGNNAGDGYILARLLHQADIHCAVMPVAPITKLRGDAMRAQNEFAIHEGNDVDVGQTLPPCDLIVDALFGTGLSRAIEGEFADAVNAINQANTPVLSLDIPSGLCANTGKPLGPTVVADQTITFIATKSGLVTTQAKHYCGKVSVAALDLPAALFEQSENLGIAINNELVKQLLPPRQADGYKNQYGHVLVIGGNIGYPNAARLAGEAAARTGAGLVSVATHPDNVAAVASGCASLMVKGIHQPSDLSELLNKADAIVLGPGLGQDKWAQKIFARVIESRKSLVVDADALQLLGKNPGKNAHWVLTPHPGEAAQLLACSSQDVQDNRNGSALAIQEQYDGVAVLKGAGTLNCYQQKIYFCPAGNVSLATGGTGDVLAGIIGGLIAQGLTHIDAANAGTMIHGLAAEQVSRNGTRGVLAQDLFPAIYPLVNQNHTENG